MLRAAPGFTTLPSLPTKASNVIDPVTASRHRRDLVVGLCIATCITVTLLWVMQYLISSGQQSLHDARNTNTLDFIRVKHAESLRKQDNRPRKPPAPERPPAEPPPPFFDALKPEPQRMAIGTVPIMTDIDLHGGFSLAVGEGDYLPIVKIAPLYPRRAQSRGIEGTCTVQYTVTRSGATRDVEVVDAECSSNLFKAASIKAAQQFKYKPRIVAGQAVEVEGVRNQFNFKLEKSK